MHTEIEQSEHRNATSPASANTSPDPWLASIEKLFQRFEDFYGAKWAAAYGGFPRDRVLRTWARELRGFAEHPECLRYATKSVCESPFPPTLPDMLAAARRAPRAPTAPAEPPANLLGYTATDEDIAEAKRRMKRMDLTADRDPLDWARRPVSPIAVRSVIDTAKRDNRFRAIVAELEAAGVIDSEGHAVKLWDRSLKAFTPCGAR